jgi:hypothetical protein
MRAQLLIVGVVGLRDHGVDPAMSGTQYPCEYVQFNGGTPGRRWGSCHGRVGASPRGHRHPEGPRTGRERVLNSVCGRIMWVVVMQGRV